MIFMSAVFGTTDFVCKYLTGSVSEDGMDSLRAPAASIAASRRD